MQNRHQYIELQALNANDAIIDMPSDETESLPRKEMPQIRVATLNTITTLKEDTNSRNRARKRNIVIVGIILFLNLSYLAWTLYQILDRVFNYSTDYAKGASPELLSRFAGSTPLFASDDPLVKKAIAYGRDYRDQLPLDYTCGKIYSDVGNVCDIAHGSKYDYLEFSPNLPTNKQYFDIYTQCAIYAVEKFSLRWPLNIFSKYLINYYTKILHIPVWGETTTCDTYSDGFLNKYYDDEFFATRAFVTPDYGCMKAAQSICPINGTSEISFSNHITLAISFSITISSIWLLSYLIKHKYSNQEKVVELSHGTQSTHRALLKKLSQETVYGENVSQEMTIIKEIERLERIALVSLAKEMRMNAFLSAGQACYASEENFLFSLFSRDQDGNIRRLILEKADILSPAARSRYAFLSAGLKNPDQTPRYPESPLSRLLISDKYRVQAPNACPPNYLAHKILTFAGLLNHTMFTLRQPLEKERSNLGVTQQKCDDFLISKYGSTIIKNSSFF